MKWKLERGRCEKVKLWGIGLMKDRKGFYGKGMLGWHLIGYGEREEGDGKG